MINTEFLLQVPGHSTILVRTVQEKVRSAIKRILGSQIDSADYYITHNGRITEDDDEIKAMHTYNVCLRVLGGKGGFGSMLRSIGAQIEKTTNREACRDLSGRRMRDVNNEKKLREWAAKAEERERAKEERRRERRERLKAPRYKFDDPVYEQQRAAATDMLDDALQKGLQNNGSGKGKGKGKAKAQKRKTDSDDDDSDLDPKKAREWLGLDVNGDSSGSSSDSESLPSSSGAAASGGETSTAGPCSSQSGAECDVSQDVGVGTNLTGHLEDSGMRSSETQGTCSLADFESISRTSSSQLKAKIPADSETIGDGQAVLAVSEDQSNIAVIEPQKTAQEIGESLNLEDYSSAEELESCGLEVLKVALMVRGVKCGGTLQERAQRLYSIRGLHALEIPAPLRAKPAKQK